MLKKRLEVQRCDALAHNPEKLEKRKKYLKEYRENCAVIGEEISIERGEEIKKGRAVEIAENFGLEVIFENGEREVITGGEVSVKGFYPENNIGRE